VCSSDLSSDFHGVFDVNCIKTEKGMVALEPTCRPGIPATSYEFMEGLAMNTGKMLEAVSSGLKTPVKLNFGPGMVVCVMSKPFPVEADMEKEATSLGEKLWIMQDGKLEEDFSDEQRKHIHLENFCKEDGVYRVATKNGYLLTVTGRGKTIGEARKNVLKYIKDNLYIAGIKYRTDIGKRVEDYYGINPEEKIKKAIVDRVESDKKKSQDEVDRIKAAIKDIVYKK
jgi:phosphoribosylamine--glycine ligase